MDEDQDSGGKELGGIFGRIVSNFRRLCSFEIWTESRLRGCFGAGHAGQELGKGERGLPMVQQ